MWDLKAVLAVMDEGKFMFEFVYFLEIVFVVFGLVGGFGDKYVCNAAVYVMYDVMSKFLLKSYDYLYGEKVVYGIFY